MVGKLALWSALVVLSSSACLLDDKQVGGEALDEAPPDPPDSTDPPEPSDPTDPCDRYCDRAATCLGEDEALCLQDCADLVLDDDCRDALLSAWSCLDMSDCDVQGAPAEDCADLLQAQRSDCESG